MSPMRNFDPRAVDCFECRAWEPFEALVGALTDHYADTFACERAPLVRSDASLLAAVHG